MVFDCSLLNSIFLSFRLIFFYKIMNNTKRTQTSNTNTETSFERIIYCHRHVFLYTTQMFPHLSDDPNQYSVLYQGENSTPCSAQGTLPRIEAARVMCEKCEHVFLFSGRKRSCVLSLIYVRDISRLPTVIQRSERVTLPISTTNRHRPGKVGASPSRPQGNNALTVLIPASLPAPRCLALSPKSRRAFGPPQFALWVVFHYLSCSFPLSHFQLECLFPLCF